MSKGKPRRRGRGRQPLPLLVLPRGLVARYERGELSAVDIGRLLGITNKERVPAALRAAGVQVRGVRAARCVMRGFDYEARREAILRLRARGMTMAAIGARFGCSKQRVWQILNEAGDSKKAAGP
jgi:hypothetical protein